VTAQSSPAAGLGASRPGLALGGDQGGEGAPGLGRDALGVSAGLLGGRAQEPA
jgi:hypothetical protein